VAVDPVERGEELTAPRGSANAAASEIGLPADVDDRLEADDRSGAVRKALASMPPRQREVLELMYFSGLSQTEVSGRLGVPLGTVKSRAFHAMQRMQELLKDAGVTA
jgi:RNA polymerase sigma-70 factor (ECF subfamily)